MMEKIRGLVSNLKTRSNRVCSLGVLSEVFRWGFSSSTAGVFLLAEEIEFALSSVNWRS